MRDIAKFIAGFERFQTRYFREDRELYERLRHAQHPGVLVIACCDSRVDPAILTGAEPGDLFVVRNVANLVPPYDYGGSGSGVCAAIEFAVQRLQVEHIIVLGHSQCGGIQALMEPEAAGSDLEFLPNWVSIASAARERVLQELAYKPPHLRARACEQAAILVSLENLLTFSWIRARIEAGVLALHGWYFDLAAGELLGYSPVRASFEALSPAGPPLQEQSP
jgi:carbonic anhydrase